MYAVVLGRAVAIGNRKYKLQMAEEALAYYE